MTYFVSSVTLNLDSINTVIAGGTIVVLRAVKISGTMTQQEEKDCEKNAEDAEAIYRADLAPLKQYKLRVLLICVASFISSQDSSSSSRRGSV